MERTSVLSKAISLMQIPAVVMIVILHSYTTARGNISETGNTAYYYLSYLLSMDFGNMGVPLYFTISGILFFNNFTVIHSYHKKIKSRIKSLLVPYFIWNLVNIIMLFILQNMEITRSYFSGNNKMISDYSMLDFLRAFWDTGTGTPILSPYWYIRNLFILQILSPVIYILTKYFKIAYLMIVGGIWLTTPTLTFTYTSVFFFSLGAYISILNIDIVKLINKYFSLLLFTFIVVLCSEIYLHFNVTSPYVIYLQKILFVLGVITIFSLAIKAVQYNIHIPASLSMASFFIYTTHYPILQGIRRISLKIISPTEIGNVGAYLGSAIITFFICLVLYHLVKRVAPQTLDIITGKRS